MSAAPADGEGATLASQWRTASGVGQAGAARTLRHASDRKGCATAPPSDYPSPAEPGEIPGVPEVAARKEARAAMPLKGARALRTGAPGDPGHKNGLDQHAGGRHTAGLPSEPQPAPAPRVAIAPLPGRIRVSGTAGPTCSHASACRETAAGHGREGTAMTSRSASGVSVAGSRSLLPLLCALALNDNYTWASATTTPGHQDVMMRSSRKPGGLPAKEASMVSCRYRRNRGERGSRPRGRQTGRRGRRSAGRHRRTWSHA